MVFLSLFSKPSRIAEYIHKLVCQLPKGNSNVGTQFTPRMGPLFQFWESWNWTISDLSI